MKKVLLVVLPYNVGTEILSKHKLRSFVAHPYGVLSIATYLKRNTDASVQVFDCNTSADWKADLEAQLQTLSPDIVGISMMFDSSYALVAPMVSQIRQWNPDTCIVMGGAAATASYTTILNEQPGIDAVCFGEGELPFRGLVEYPNIFKYLETGQSWVTRNRINEFPVRSKIEDLDEVVDIDYSFIDLKLYHMQNTFSPYAQHKSGQQFFVVSSRGCPFWCNFCVNSANPDKSMRYASVDKLIEHVRKLVDVYGMTNLTFFDDQILFNKKRAKELFRRLAEFKIRVDCPNGLSVAFIDDELAGLMKAAGMDTVCLAIESGSKYVLETLIKKPLKLHQVKPVVDILRKHDFWISGFFVFGVPGETHKHRMETVQSIQDWDLDWSSIQNACPSRGSLLYKECIEKGYIPKDMKIDDLDMNRYIITQPEQDPDTLMKESYLINLDVNFIHNRRMRIGDYPVAIQAFEDVLVRYPNHAAAHLCLSIAHTKMYEKLKYENPEWEEYETVLYSQGVV